MLGIFSFIVLIIGALNWFCIGLLQFDFVAGLFGSQASIFSRIIYVAVGVSAFIVLSILIKNKGKIVFNLSKIKEKFMKKKNQKTETSPVQAMEASKDNHPTDHNMHMEASSDYFKNDYVTHHENHTTHSKNLEAGNDYNHDRNYSDQNSYKDN